MSHPLDPLLETIAQAPNCSVTWCDANSLPWSPPRELPEDLAYFCSRISDGNLFYQDDPHVPQIGCSLALAFSEPVYSFPEMYRADYPRLDTLFEIVYDPEAGEYAYTCVDLHPARFGRMYDVNYDLGEPDPCIRLIGRSFTEWLQMLVEVGTLHAEDWRAACNQLGEHAQKMAALTGPVDEIA